MAGNTKEEVQLPVNGLNFEQRLGWCMGVMYVVKSKSKNIFIFQNSVVSNLSTNLDIFRKWEVYQWKTPHGLFKIRFKTL